MADNEGATPLIIACQNGNVKQLQDLIDSGVSMSDKDGFGRTALHHCVENADTECAEVLLKADPSLLSATDGEGLSPLHMAVIAGNVPLIHLLLKRGASLHCRDQEQHTVAHWATVCGHATVLDVLLQYGADLSAADKHQAYPVHYAAQMTRPPGEESGSSDSEGGGEQGSLTLLKKLLANKVSPEVRDKDQRTPIIWAASAGNAEACRILVEAGADVNSEDKDGLSALHCAASRGHVECARVLVSTCKARVDPVDKNQCTPLFYATTLGHQKCAQTLLELGASPSHTDARGRTTAHCAAVKGSRESLKALRKQGVDLWQPTAKGDYPIHEAAQAGHEDVVKYLLSVKPDGDGEGPGVDVVNRDGRTCLHIAALTNNLFLAKFLLDNGANVNAVMRNKGKNYTPYDAAVAKGNKEAAEYLQSRGGQSADKVTDDEVKDRPRSAASSKGKKKKKDSADKNAEDQKQEKQQETDKEGQNAQTDADGQEVTVPQIAVALVTEEQRERPKSASPSKRSGKSKDSRESSPEKVLDSPKKSSERTSSPKKVAEPDKGENAGQAKEENPGVDGACPEENGAVEIQPLVLVINGVSSPVKEEGKGEEEPRTSTPSPPSQDKDQKQNSVSTSDSCVQTDSKPGSPVKSSSKPGSPVRSRPVFLVKVPSHDSHKDSDKESDNESQEKKKNDSQVTQKDSKRDSKKDLKQEKIVKQDSSKKSKQDTKKRYSKESSKDKKRSQEESQKDSRHDSHKDTKPQKKTSQKTEKDSTAPKSRAAQSPRAAQNNKSANTKTPQGQQRAAVVVVKKSKTRQVKQETPRQQTQQKQETPRSRSSRNSSRSSSSTSSKSSSSKSSSSTSSRSRSRSSSRSSRSSSRSSTSHPSTMGSKSSKNRISDSNHDNDGDGLNLFSDNENDAGTDHDDVTPRAANQKKTEVAKEKEKNPEKEERDENTVKEPRKRPRSSRLIAAVQDSVRRYEQERKSIRQFYQLRRAQIYSGHAHDVALFRSLMLSYNTRNGAPTLDQMLQDHAKHREERSGPHYGRTQTAKSGHRQASRATTDSKNSQRKNDSHDRDHEGQTSHRDKGSDKSTDHKRPRTSPTRQADQDRSRRRTERGKSRERAENDVSPQRSPSPRRHRYPADYNRDTWHSDHKDCQRHRQEEMQRLLFKAYRPSLPRDLFSQDKHRGGRGHTPDGGATHSPASSRTSTRPSTTRSMPARPVGRGGGGGGGQGAGRATNSSFNSSSGQSATSGVSHAQFRTMHRSYTIMTPQGMRRYRRQDPDANAGPNKKQNARQQNGVAHSNHDHHDDRSSERGKSTRSSEHTADDASR